MRGTCVRSYTASVENNPRSAPGRLTSLIGRGRCKHRGRAAARYLPWRLGGHTSRAGTEDTRRLVLSWVKARYGCWTPLSPASALK